MPVTKDGNPAYTSPSAVLDIIDRYRNKSLPKTISAETLGQIGIAESLIQRTLQSLQALDLIDAEGKVTGVLDGLRHAPEAEYKKCLVDWLNNAYAEVLQFVDPSTDDETTIRDAFRPYNPPGQTRRMVTLFQGLYAAAGVGAEKIRARPVGPPRIRPVAPSQGPRTRVMPKKTAASQSTGLPAALEGLMRSLPAEGEGWTQAQRDKFVTTFGAVIDFCFPISESGVTGVPGSEEEDR